MAILNAALMLPGLIWLGPLPAKSICPNTPAAALELGGKRSTRLLPESARKIFPSASILTSAGAASDVAEARGNAFVFAVTIVKFGCPMTSFAGEPAFAPLSKMRTRLSLGTATYKFPTPSSHRFVGHLYVAVPNDNRVLIFDSGAKAGSPAKDVIEI